MNYVFSKIIDPVLSLFFPKICIGCGLHLNIDEELICLHCKLDLPYTYYENWEGNPVEQIFFGRVVVQQAMSLLHFNKNNITERLIYQLKYKGNEAVGSYLGYILGERLRLSNRFKTIDAIVYVPIHNEKIKKRGYNQLTQLCITLSQFMNVELYHEALQKIDNSTAQAHKNRAERFEHLQDKFRLKNPELLAHKHLLLVDDVITTGATIESCILELLKVSEVKVSVLTVAIRD